MESSSSFITSSDAPLMAAWWSENFPSYIYTWEGVHGAMPWPGRPAAVESKYDLVVIVVVVVVLLLKSTCLQQQQRGTEHRGDTRQRWCGSAIGGVGRTAHLIRYGGRGGVALYPK